jgi:hypothetical protein
MTPIRITRRLFQFFFLAGCVWLMARLLAGVGTRTVEYYCPMGGVVSIWGLFRRQQFICALNEMNVSIGLALIISVVLVKKAFCGWVCPLGTLFEGVRCYGTADYLREHIEHLPGLVSMVAYAGKHRVVVEYSEQAVSLDTIIAEIERPVQTEDGLIQYFDVVSRKNM